jgi:hypothetical protein
MPSARYFELAERVGAYGGVIALRMRTQDRRETQSAPTPAVPVEAPPGARQVESSRAALTNSDIGDMFSWG